MKIKICGMRDPANIAEIAALAPDYMGFIFYPKSSRYVGQDFAPAWGPETEAIRKVAVFVNESLDSALEITDRLGFDMVQLHGNETPAYCREMKQAGLEVIKAFGIGPEYDFSQLEPFGEWTDFYLLDARTPIYGGSGERFDWKQLEQYREEKPFFFSGGLEPANLKEAVAAAAGTSLHALDLNSRIELAPALKNAEMAATAIQLVKQLVHENEK